MKKRRLLTLPLTVAFVMVVPMPGATSCHMIEAVAVGQDDGTGKTTGKVIGGGLLHGTLEGAVTPTSPPVDGVVTFTEIVKFTTENGTLTVQVGCSPTTPAPLSTSSHSRGAGTQTGRGAIRQTRSDRRHLRRGTRMASE